MLAKSVIYYVLQFRLSYIISWVTANKAAQMQKWFNRISDSALKKVNWV